MTKGDAPSVNPIDAKDSLTIQSKRNPFSFKESQNQELNELIVDCVNLMGGVGDNAETKYQSSIASLLPRKQEVVYIIASEYRNLSKGQYLDRWSLVQLLSDLKDPLTLRIMDEILSNPIPPEESDHLDSFTTVGEEVMIRTNCIEAATKIAASGNSEALDLLLKYAKHENFSVKRTSIQGYVAHGGRDARQKLLQILPEKDHFILDIHRVSVQKVFQPRGEKYLARQEREEIYKLPTIEGVDNG